MNDVETWDELEVPDVGSPHGVTEFERTDPDQKIRESDSDTPRLTLAVDLPGADRDGRRHRLDGDSGEEIVKETLPTFTAFRGIGSHDSMGEFEHGNHGDSDSFVARFERHVFEELPGSLARAFGGDGGC